MYYLLGALAVTLWLWRDPASRTVAGNPNDADQIAWFFRYDATAVAHLRLPALVTTAMNAPQGVNAMWNTFMMLPGVLLAPVTLLFGPQSALTLFMTAGFAGSATAMFAVLRRWDVSGPAAALGGAVYGFSPAVLHSAIGHYDLQFAVLPPLIVHICLRLATGRTSAVRGGLWLGLLVTAQVFITEETLLGTAMAVVIILAVLAVSRPRAVADKIATVAAGLGVAACVTAVIAGYPLWMQFFGPLPQHGSPFTPDFFKNDLSSFVVPSSYLLFHTSASAAAALRYQGHLPEYLGYLGWPLIIVLLLAMIAGWRRLPVRAARGCLRRAQRVLARRHPAVRRARAPRDQAALVLAGRPAAAQRGPAGPVLHRGGRRGRRAPGLRRGRGPAGLRRLRRPVAAAARRRLAARRGGDVRRGPGRLAHRAQAPARRRHAPVPPGWSAAFAALRLPASASVLVVPIPMSTFTEPLRWQADTGEPGSLVGGYFMGPAWNGRGYIDGNGTPAAGLYLNAIWTFSQQGLPKALAGGLPPNAYQGSAGYVPVKVVTDTKMREQIKAWRVSAVVAVAELNSRLGQYLTALLGRPAVVAGDVLAWRTSAK